MKTGYEKKRFVKSKQALKVNCFSLFDSCNRPLHCTDCKKNREAWEIEENLKLQRTDALWFIHSLCLVLLVLNYDQM
jgi:hypothetical protein